MTYRCADCRKAYTDCRCPTYMSQGYVDAGGSMAGHKAFLGVQRGIVKQPATVLRKAKQNALAGLVALAIGLLSSSCASTKPASVTFVAPSVAPLKQAVSSSEQRIRGAADAAKKLDAACEQKSAGWADAYGQLNTELTNAYAGLATAQDLADELGQRAVTLAEQANQVAKQRDSLFANSERLEASRHGWVKRFWWATGVATALGVWTLRKPLMMVAGL